ncbi:hypothetical protein KEH51_29250 [[Brevibacterium] frigoritolerans]|uniref:Uncharacterized protein n=1 Tax=Peribacillus frigoritolerans TaxID=450367 RepID=A0A941FKK1_9BACI|nr:hypothetical protein [Peribacillus frigoritolerans]
MKKFLKVTGITIGSVVAIIIIALIIDISNDPSPEEQAQIEAQEAAAAEKAEKLAAEEEKERIAQEKAEEEADAKAAKEEEARLAKEEADKKRMPNQFHMLN